MENTKPKRGRPKGSKNVANIEKEKVAGDVKGSNLTVPAKRGRPKNPTLPGGQRHYMKTTNHVYTELAKTAISSTDQYDIYGIVVDSTTPHKVEGKGYKTHLRIIDPSLQGTGKVVGGNENVCQSINVTILAQKEEQLPVFKKLGELFRIHRCTIGNYKGNRSFLANVNYGSSWVVFEGMP